MPQGTVGACSFFSECCIKLYFQFAEYLHLLWIFQERKWSYHDFHIGLVVTSLYRSQRLQIIVSQTMPCVTTTKMNEKCIQVSGRLCQIESNFSVYLRVCQCRCGGDTLLHTGVDKENLVIIGFFFQKQNIFKPIQNKVKKTMFE